MGLRESFYVCRFRSARDVRTSHVRAWDAREAERAFREELRVEGVAEAGLIEVDDGEEILRSTFEPQSGEARPPQG